MPTQRITTAADAAKVLAEGGLVAFPTETVFGLGVDAANATAVDRLFEAKGRPSDNPLIVHLADAEAWPLAASEMPDSAERLLGEFAPGPLTVVVPRLQAICPRVSAGLETVGIRIPSHPFALEILRQAERPIAAPSANRSGRPSCTTWRSVLEDLDGRIDAVVCQDADGVGIESTVVDCVSEPPVLLRPGAVTLGQLRQVVPDLRSAAEAVAGEHNVRSPGVAHPHYQPRATVVLVDGAVHLDAIPQAERAAYCGLIDSRLDADVSAALLFAQQYATLDEYAAGFYEFLREADRRGADTVFVQLVGDDGLGAALRDRQLRAAGAK